MTHKDKYELVSELARRRGFFWPSFEIYGGVGGYISYGPLGILLKERIIEKFRRFYLSGINAIEVDSPIIMPGKVFEASGHVEHFREPMMECSKCGRKFRLDHLLRDAGMSDTEAEKLNLQEMVEEIERRDIRCPECGGKLVNPIYFTTMFQTTIGPYSDAVGYGRPEAAQGVFVEFRRLYQVAREKLPFAGVQIGRAMRNEISPRQGPIRLREFTIIDMEFFFDPEEPSCPLLPEVEDEVLRLIPAELKLKGVYEPVDATVREALDRGYILMEWQAYFMARAKQFLELLGVPAEKQRFIEKLEWERAHYSAQGYDQEVYLDRWGWVEVSGHNYRTDYDLSRHMKYSGEDLQVFKEFKEPIITERKVVRTRIPKIKEDFGGEAEEVLKLIASLTPTEAEKELREKGYIELANGRYRLTDQHIHVQTIQEKKTGKRFVPHVIEPSFGVDRLFYVTLEYAYRTKDGRIVLSLPRDLAPIEVAVFPLVSRDGLPEKAREVYKMLVEEGFRAEYDEVGSIGRRYARADEVGIPIAITIDYQSLEDDTATLRDRDTWSQARNAIERLPQLLHEYFRYKIDFEDLGEPVKAT